LTGVSDEVVSVSDRERLDALVGRVSALEALVAARRAPLGWQAVAWVSLAEFAAMWGVTPATARRWAAAGRIPAATLRIGPRVRYRIPAWWMDGVAPMA